MPRDPEAPVRASPVCASHYEERSLMIHPGSIVVGADGSHHADRAVRWAAEQANLEHRPLTVVAVGQDAPTIAEGAAALARRMSQSLSVQPLCRDGDPGEVLLEMAEDAYLVVLGSRGRGTLKSMLLGSVSSAVSARAACAVVVCRPVADHVPTHGIVVGADGTQESLPAIEFAYRQAALRQLPLTVLHSFWDAAVAVAQYRQAAGLTVTEPELEDLRALLSASVSGLAETYPDAQVTFELKHGFVDQALAPRGRSWDLIVVGRRPIPTSAKLLSESISHAVLERARTTVAVVPAAVRQA